MPLLHRQHHLLRHHHEELRGVEHFAQVAHDDQVRAEDDVQLLGDNYLYVPGRGHDQVRSRVEYLVHCPNDSLLHSVPYYWRHYSHVHCESLPDPQAVERGPVRHVVRGLERSRGICPGAAHRPVARESTADLCDDNNCGDLLYCVPAGECL